MDGRRTEVVQCANCGHQNRIPVAADGSPRCGHCGASLPWIVEAGDADFADVAERSTLFVVVDLWAPWCGPCRQISPALERLATELAGQLKLVKVNVDVAVALPRRYQVQAIPTLLVLHHGEVVARQTGAVPPRALRSWVQQAMAEAAGRAS